MRIPVDKLHQFAPGLTATAQKRPCFPQAKTRRTRTGNSTPPAPSTPPRASSPTLPCPTALPQGGRRNAQGTATQRGTLMLASSTATSAIVGRGTRAASRRRSRTRLSATCDVRAGITGRAAGRGGCRSTSMYRLRHRREGRGLPYTLEHGDEVVFALVRFGLECGDRCSCRSYAACSAIMWSRQSVMSGLSRFDDL